MAGEREARYCNNKHVGERELVVVEGSSTASRPGWRCVGCGARYVEMAIPESGASSPVMYQVWDSSWGSGSSGASG